jgi:Ctf8
MDIGLHLLEGNIVKLKLPFLVIEKRKRTRSSSNSEQEISGTDSDLTDSPSLDIIGVVRKKIIFKTRPKPKCNVARN